MAIFMRFVRSEIAFIPVFGFRPENIPAQTYGERIRFEEQMFTCSFTGQYSSTG